MAAPPIDPKPAEPLDEVENFGSEEGASGSVTDPAENRIAAGIRHRLRQAVERAGGAASLARRSGVALSNLNKYLRGRDMKAGTMVRLAEAAAVRIEWLATGRGAMTPGDELQRELVRSEGEQPALSRASSGALFGRIDADRLAAAYRGARQAMAARGQPEPDPRRLMQATIMLYDYLTETEDQAGPAPAPPQDDPQASPQGSPGEMTKSD